MKLFTVVLVVAAVAGAAAGGAGASVFKGAVVGSDSARHAIAVASPAGAVRTVRVQRMRALGARVSVAATRRADGTYSASRITTTGRASHARVHGVVVRQQASRTLLSAGGTVLAVRSSGRLSPGTVVTMEVDIEHDGLQGTKVAKDGTAGQLKIEGKVVTVSPLTVAVEEGAPITIDVPAGVTLPAGLAVRDQIEAVVTFSAGTYTLVSIEDSTAGEPGDGGGGDQGQEVEAEGTVTALTADSITVTPEEHGAPVTFVIPAGFDLKGATMGSKVDAKGTTLNGVTTLTKIEVKDSEDDQGDQGGDGGGSGGDGDHGGGGGHDGHDGGGGGG